MRPYGDIRGFFLVPLMEHAIQEQARNERPFRDDQVFAVWNSYDVARGVIPRWSVSGYARENESDAAAQARTFWESVGA